MAKNQGIKSRNLVHPGIRTGAPREHIQKAATVRLGQSQGNHATGKGKTNNPHIDLVGPKHPISGQQGSEWSRTVKQGPGGGCNPMRAGSQGMHGEVSGKAESAPRSGDVMSRK
jgi:hypothetical protein